MGIEVSVFQVEIDFSGHPLLVAFGEQRRDKSQTGSGIGEDGSNTSPTFDFAVNAFKAVGRA